MLVVIVHTPNYWGFELPHGFLAVDLFFSLSGFVLASAYKNKLETGSISIRRFFVIRLIRLYPVLLFGMLASGGIALSGVLIHHNRTLQIVYEYIFATLFGLFLLPYKISDTNSIFPLNGAIWSLFFEIIANNLVAIATPFISKLLTVIILIFLAVFLSWACLSNTGINFGVNWGWISLAGGLARATYGMLAGASIYVIHKKFKVPKLFSSALFPIAAALLVAVCASPEFTVGFEYFFQIFAVVIIMPSIVMIAACANTERLRHLMEFSGAISYPLYVFHGIIIHLFESIRGRNTTSSYPATGLLLLLASISLAYLVDRFYDIPVRGKLRKLLLDKKVTATSQFSAIKL